MVEVQKVAKLSIMDFRRIANDGPLTRLMVTSHGGATSAEDYVCHNQFRASDVLAGVLFQFKEETNKKARNFLTSNELAQGFWDEVNQKSNSIF